MLLLREEELYSFFQGRKRNRAKNLVFVKRLPLELFCEGVFLQINVFGSLTHHPAPNWILYCKPEILPTSTMLVKLMHQVHVVRRPTWQRNKEFLVFPLTFFCFFFISVFPAKLIRCMGLSLPWVLTHLEPCTLDSLNANI